MDALGSQPRWRWPAARQVGEAVVVAVGGFALMNLAFLLYFLFVTAIDRVLFTGDGAESAWFRAVEMGAFIALLLLATVAVVRSRLPELAKATWSTVPLVAVYAALGASLWRQAWLPLLTGGLVFVAVAAGYRARGAGWLHWWALAFVSLAMLTITLTGTDI